MTRLSERISWALVAALSLLVIASLAGVVRGGPLDPPAPVGPTGKTVITSLPFTISQPGSYVLNSNLTCTACSVGEDGIHVSASNVTIDLQGFELVGVSGALSGIEVFTNNVEVRNGTIRDWPDAGVFGPYLTAAGTTIDAVRLTANGWGLTLADDARVSNCLVIGSASLHGVLVGNSGTITNCTVANNAGVEIFANDGAVVENCAVDGNGTAGNGLVVGANSVVRGCIARNNGGIEIEAGTGSTLENCTADGNNTPGNGIQVSHDSIIRGCSAFNNGGTEIFAGNQVVIEDCVAEGFTGAARGPGNGIRIGFKSTVQNCTASNNAGTGILVEGTSVTIENCVSADNDGRGIDAQDGTIIGCTVRSNGSDEIWFNAGATIENCQVEGAGTEGHGIRVGHNSTIRGCIVSANGSDEILANGQTVIENCGAHGAGTAGVGILVGADSTVRNRVTTNNGGDEIAALDRSVVEGCTADGWTGSADGPGDGIVVTHNGTVKNSTAQNNEGAGLHAFGQNNRIESNHVVGNTAAGIDIDGPNNVIVLNSASGNAPNYSVVAGNQYETAGPVAGDTNPWANIEY